MSKMENLGYEYCLQSALLKNCNLLLILDSYSDCQVKWKCVIKSKQKKDRRMFGDCRQQGMSGESKRFTDFFSFFFFLLYRSLCLSMCSAVIKSLKVENHKIVRRNQKSFFICQFHYGKRLFWSHTQTVKNDLYILTGWFSVLECIQLLLPLAWQFSEHFSFLNSINTKRDLEMIQSSEHVDCIYANITAFHTKDFWYLQRSWIQLLPDTER